MTTVRLPPLEYMLVVDLDDEGEPQPVLRQALQRMTQPWNDSHTAQFVWRDEGGFETFSVILQGGAHDPERPTLERHLDAIEQASGVRASCGTAGPMRTAERHARADFIKVLAEGAPMGFVTNLYASSGPRPCCSTCGRDLADADRPSLRPLSIDVAYLRRWARKRGTPIPGMLCIDHRHRLRDEMQAWAKDLEDPVIPHDGLPFATIPASSDLLVLFEGLVYYVSPLCSGPHNEVVAEDLEEFFGIVVGDLARFVMETASVVRYRDEQGEQWYPVAFRRSGSPLPRADRERDEDAALHP